MEGKCSRASPWGLPGVACHHSPPQAAHLAWWGVCLDIHKVERGLVRLSSYACVHVCERTSVLLYVPMPVCHLCMCLCLCVCVCLCTPICPCVTVFPCVFPSVLPVCVCVYLCLSDCLSQNVYVHLCVCVSMSPFFLVFPHVCHLCISLC